MRLWRVVLRIARTDWGVLTFLLVSAWASGIFWLFAWPAMFQAPSRFLPAVGEISPNFVTSVMVATGRGFVEPVEGDGRFTYYPQALELTKFLRHERIELSASQIPSDLATRPPQNDWPERHRYLLCAVGLLWRVFGISWHVVTGLRVAMHCLMIGSIYGLMRLGTGRTWSAAGTLFLAVVPLFFGMTNIRDYGKGPLFLSAMLVIGYLVTHTVRRRTFFGLSVVLGLIIGFGVGFRADLLVCLPPSLFVLAFCRRTHTRTGIVERLAAIGLLMVSFAAPASQIMGFYGGGSLFAHDILMGLSTKCDDMLGTNRASYEKVYVNDDSLVAAMAVGFSERGSVPGGFTAALSNEHLLLLHFAATFPGDLLTRAYSSVLWVVRWGIPSMWFGVCMALFTAATLLTVARRDLGRAWMTLFLLLYFCGYLSLQPEGRHAFHLAFVFLFIVGFVMDRAVRAIRKQSFRGVVRRVVACIAAPRLWWTPSMKRMMQFAVPAIALLAIPLYAARAYQDVAVARLLDRYAGANLMPVAVKRTEVKGWTMFQRTRQTPMRSGMLPAPRVFNIEYWVAEFAPDTQWRRIWLQYMTGDDSASCDWFSHGLWVAPSEKGDSGNMKYFFPVVECSDISQKGWALFSGIGVPKEQAGDFRGLYRVRNDRDFPLLLNMSFAADRNSIMCHQTVWGATSTKLDADVARYWLSPMPLFTIPTVSGTIAPEEADDRIEAYREGLVADPQNALLLLGVAVCLEQRVDCKTALEAYRDALAADPRFFATYHYIDAFFKRRVDTAGRIAFWRGAARAYPENYLPSFHLGLACEACYDTDGAIEAYRKVTELCPADAETLADLGRLFVDKNDLNAAIDVYQCALQADPFNRQIASSLNGLLERRGNR